MKRQPKFLSRYAAAGLALTLAASPAAFAGEPIAPASTHAGVVGQILINPHGDVDGLLLKDGALVRFPPHTVVSAGALIAGASVQVEGESMNAGGGLMLFDARVSVGGRTVVDPFLAPQGPHKPRPPGGPDAGLVSMTASGRVRLLLTNPDGVPDGFTLEDGTVIHAGPHSRLGRMGLAPGSTVNVTGLGGTYPAGRSLEASTLQVGDGPVYDLVRGPRRAAPPPPPAP